MIGARIGYPRGNWKEDYMVIWECRREPVDILRRILMGMGMELG
jgi:hypothetical protein